MGVPRAQTVRAVVSSPINRCVGWPSFLQALAIFLPKLGVPFGGEWLKNQRARASAVFRGWRTSHELDRGPGRTPRVACVWGAVAKEGSGRQAFGWSERRATRGTHSTGCSVGDAVGVTYGADRRDRRYPHVIAERRKPPGAA